MTKQPMFPHPKHANLRFAKFAKRADVIAVQRKYDSFLLTSEGERLATHYSAFAFSRLAGEISMKQSRKAIRLIARHFGLPDKDVRLLADFTLEMFLCGLVATGQHPQTEV